jgi:RNA polymerase sigma-70 factor (ECF subfamily)
MMNSLSETERELVDRARGGDDLAFEELVRRYQRQIYAFLYRLSGNMDDAMELTQSAFVRSWASVSRFRGESSFRTYLYRIAANAWRNMARDKSRRKPVDLETVSLTSGDDPHAEAEKTQERRRLWDSVERLSPRQREVLVLRVREGLTFEDAAAVMGCSVGSAKASYHHAVARLKADLRGRD